jgi:parvulin-like peptidyl-prolyl isomerase
MAMMAKMRSLAPWFIITVGGLFVLFMVLSDSKLSDIVTSPERNVGSVNGVDISYQQFQQFYEQAKQNQIQQTGREIDESQEDTFRDQVWEAVVRQTLMTEKIDEFGITVTDEEVRDVILGPNPPEYLKQGFIDSTGNFNRAAYDEALRDPRNVEPVIAAEQGVKQQLISEKLQNYVNAAVSVSQDEIRRAYVDQNIKMSADYAMIDLNTIPDSTIEVTEDDIKEYYNENKENYKVAEQRKIKYVMFKKEATKADSIDIEKNLNEIVEDLKKDTASFKTYVEIYSSEPYSLDTVAITRIPEEAQELIANSNTGDIIGPVQASQSYIVYNVVKKIRAKDEVVRASHILVGADGDFEKAKKEADEIYNQLKNGADFAELAKEKSDDPGSAARGGDLGWFGKGQMVPEFEKASFSGRIGRVQRPVKTNFGYHIIKTTGKNNEKYVIQKIVNTIEPSPSTLDRIQQDASDFSYLADKNGFESEAELMKFEIKESQFFAAASGTIPGIGKNNALVRFAFDNDVDDISNVFRLPQGWIVAKVEEVKKEGFKPLEEVKPAIEREVLREKKLEKTFEIAKEVKAKVSETGTLQSATTVYPKAKVSTATDFTTNGNVGGLGKDFAFTGYALEGEKNKISDPIKGSRGSYLIKVIKRTEFDSTAYSLQQNFLRDNLLRQKKARFFNEWVTNLKNDAEIEDNRHIFYR